MTPPGLVERDRDAELDTLARVERVSGCAGFAGRVVRRLDEVEAAGGPDAPAADAPGAVRGAHEEAVDGVAWTMVARAHLRGREDEPGVAEALVLIEEADVWLARAEQALRGAHGVLEAER